MYEEQIKYREQLLNYHKITYITILEQLKDLKSKQGLIEIEKFITDFGFLPISRKIEKYNPSIHSVGQSYDKEKLAQISKGDILRPKQYSTSTSEGVSVNYSTAEGIKQMNQFSPQKEKRILVVDIKYITSDLKSYNEADLKNKLEGLYNCNIFLVDSSKQNLQGGTSAYNNPPIYFA